MNLSNTPRRTPPKIMEPEELNQSFADFMWKSVTGKNPDGYTNIDWGIPQQPPVVGRIEQLTQTEPKLEHRPQSSKKNDQIDVIIEYTEDLDAGIRGATWLLSGGFEFETHAERENFRVALQEAFENYYIDPVRVTFTDEVGP